MSQIEDTLRWIEERVIGESIEYLIEKEGVKDIYLLDIGEKPARLNEYRQYIRKANFVDMSKMRDSTDEQSKVNLLNFETGIKKYKYNLILCNLTIDYFFKSGRLLRDFMRLVREQLTENGLFVGIAINGDRVMQLFMHYEELNRRLFRLKSTIRLEESKTPYGNTFELQVGDHKKTHYAVSIEKLKEMAHSHDLLFIGTMSGKQWLNRYEEKKEHNLTKEEKEFLFLHFSYFFKKRYNK